MATSNKKFVYVKKNETFTSELATTYANSIVFIEDEGVIKTHGKSFGLSATDKAALVKRVGDLEALRWFNGVAEIGEGKSVFNAATGATTIKFGGDDKGLVTVTVDANGVHIAVKEVTAEGANSYVSASASTDGSNKVTVTANVTKIADIKAENSTESGAGKLADIKDVVDYIDTEISTVQGEIDGQVMEDGYTADVMIGGLNKGTDLGGKTAEEVLDLILKPEYAPTFTDATVSIACTANSNGAILEVGSKTPAENTYSASGSTAYAKAGSNIANGGDASNSFSIAVHTAAGNDYDTVTTKPGKFTVKVTRTYAAGTEVVKTNKGNATNKIASNPTTLVANASVSGIIDSDKHIKEIVKTAEHTVNYGYKVYATTGVAGTLADQDVKISVSNLEFTLKGGSAGQKIALPASYTGVKIEEFNSTLNSWTDVTSGWETSSTSYTLADGVTSKAYTVYTRSNNSGEDVVMRVSATVA